MYVDELEDNPCRVIVVWRPKNPVLTGDFKWLFDLLRENPSELSPHMVIPEVDAPTPPRNLAAILQALENGDSDLPAPEYEEDASREEADVEIHPAENIPAEENNDDDLTTDSTIENDVPLN